VKHKLFSIISFLILIALSRTSYAQPDTLWTKTFGGSADEECFSLQMTQDGGYILSGYSESFGAGDKDVWLIKTDADGDTTWTKTHGGTGEDVGNCVQQTSDDGFIVAGYTRSFGAGQRDVWLLKTDADGDTAWTKTFGKSGHDHGFSVQQTGDGGYIITGDTFSDASGSLDLWLIKTDASGDTLWTKTFDGTSYERGQSVQQTDDGGYIVTGYTDSHGAGSTDVWLIKTDELGNEEWTKTYGGDQYDKGYAIKQTSDGGYIIAGFNKSYGPGIEDVWLLKTDASGDTVWTKLYGGIENDESKSVEQTSDGGYIVTGHETSGGSHNLWIIKTDAAGDTSWTKKLGGDQNDFGNAVQQTSDLGYIVAGTTESSGNGKKDIWLIRLAHESELSVVSGKLTPNGFVLMQNFPNPFNPVTTIQYSLDKSGFVTLTLYNVHGREIHQLVNEQKEAGLYRTVVDVKDLSSGLYYYRLTVNGHHETKKMMQVK